MPIINPNSFHFNGKGLLTKKSPIPNRYGVIGNGAKSLSTIYPFSFGELDNSSVRYLFARNDNGLYELKGPFAADVLATFIKGGIKYGQFESYDETLNSYSHDLSSQFTSFIYTYISNDQTNDPVGGSQADQLREQTNYQQHWATYPIAVVNGSTYAYSIFLKPDLRTEVRLALTGVISKTVYLDIDLSNGTETDSDNIDASFIGRMIDNWTYVIAFITADATGSADVKVQLLKDGATTYSGTTGRGIYFWGHNFRESDRESSYIEADGSPGSRSPDIFSFPSEDLSNWLTEAFRVELSLSYDFPSQIDVDKPIWTHETDPVIYYEGANNYGLKTDDTYLYWANSAGLIKRCKLDGSELIDLISSGLTTPDDICLRDSYIYISDYSGKIVRANIDGSGVADFITGLTSPAGICTDDTYLYWSDFGAQKIQRALRSDGSGITDLATGETTPRSARINDGYVYWSSSNTGNIRRIPVGGGTAENILTGCGQPFGIFVDDNYIYYCSIANATINVANKRDLIKHVLCDLSGAYTIAVREGAFFCTYSLGAIVRRVNMVTAWLCTDGKIRVIEGAETKIETSAAAASTRQDISISFDRLNHSIKLDGFTSGDGLYSSGSQWTACNGFDLEYGGALHGAASLDGIASVPIKERSL